MPRLAVVGRLATASGDFLPDDVPGTSGRLDVLLRCIRAGFLWSHGMRNDVVLYLVLGGGPLAPRTLRIDGATARFLRPDERSLATLVRKALATRADEEEGAAFAEARPGISIARAGVEGVLGDLAEGAPLFVLDEAGDDVRAAPGLEAPEAAFFIGDHLGFDDATRALLASRGARPIRLGPRSLHAEDAVAVLLNEIDRRLLPLAPAGRSEPSD